MANLTPEQNQIALNLLASQVANDLGLIAAQRATWTNSERSAYLQEFKNLLLANPGNFSDASITIAQNIHPQNSDLVNAFVDDLNATRDVLTASVAGGFDFTEQVVDAAGNLTQAGLTAVNGVASALNGIGQGVNIAGKIAPYVLPAAALLFLFLFTSAKSGSKILERRLS